MKPIPKIIELARKLYAAGYRKEIEQGDWFFNAAFNEGHLWIYSTPRQEVYVKDNDNIPIPTLTQCLDFIESKGFYAISDAGDSYRYCRWKLPLNSFWKYQKAETRLEAAMLAVLKILGGE